MNDVQPGHGALRRGRVSTAGTEYFLTICTKNRAVGLTDARVAQSIRAAIHAMSADGTWQERCSVVMPDHMHLLIILGERLSLGKSVARLKGKTAFALALASPLCAWERDFFD